MRDRTCCFTGHRDLPIQGREELAAKLEHTIIGLIDRGIQFYGAGGARGFDTLAAQTVLKLKERYPHIKLILILPCLTQTKNWPTTDVEEYERIKALADRVVYTSQEYTKDCMHKRNRHLVDHSSVCVCYLANNNSGTAYTVNYARKMGREIILIDPATLNIIHRENCKDKTEPSKDCQSHTKPPPKGAGT